MAIYEYGCKKCGKKFELMRRVSQRDESAVCKHCGSKSTKRVEIQRVAIITGVAPNAMAGEGEPEDFLDGSDDFGDMDFGDDDF